MQILCQIPALQVIVSRARRIEHENKGKAAISDDTVNWYDCFFVLFYVRVVWRLQVRTYDIISFIGDFCVVKKDRDAYINLSKNRDANSKIKKATGLANLDALYLSEREIENLFDCILPM